MIIDPHSSKTITKINIFDSLSTGGVKWPPSVGQDFSEFKI
jgi:hypothetical protein